ncbi:MAG: 6-phosphogluconolactonase [Hyphomonadaceae bacterium]
MKPIREFATREALADAAAAGILQALRTGVLQRGVGLAALSGGETPELTYRKLATQPYHWAKVTFLMVDERFVPLSDPDSNEAMLRRTLAPALAAGATLLPLFADGVSLEEAAARADTIYAEKAIDIAVMGMGNDGHTASWFPQSPQLGSAVDPNNRHSVIAVTAPGASGSQQRLTLTRSAIGRAGAIALLITGGAKLALLEDCERASLPVDILFDFDLDETTETCWAP